MKKCFVLLIALLLCFCTACATEKSESYFNAKVLEISESFVLVEPVAGEEILKSSDRITVSKDVGSKDGVPELNVGDEIRVVYDGIIQETYPSGLGKVYAIYLASELEE